MLGKVGFDPGHFQGHNVYKDYIEGNTMLKLGLALNKEYGSPLSRYDGKDLSFQLRAKTLKAAGCNSVISLHSNYPTDGVLVIYSLNRPQDKPIAEHIAKEIAKAIGTTWRVWTRASSHSVAGKPVDYYGIIRHSINAGLQPFIVEHGSHKEMSADTEQKIKAIVECYGKLMGIEKPLTTQESIDILAGVNVLTDKNKWLKKAVGDSDIYFLLSKMAKYVKGSVKS